MNFIGHFFQIILFLVVSCGPVPLSLAFAIIGKDTYTVESRTYNLLSFLTIWTGIQVFIVLLAGMLGHLDLYSIFFIEIITLIAGFVILRVFVGQLPKVSNIYLFSQNLTITPSLKLKFYIFCLGIILLIQLATQPVIDYDSLWYHLPFMARWQQDFSFTILPEFSRLAAADWIAEQIGYYPFSWEALCTLFIIPFKEDFLVTLPNLISWVILGLSTYLMGLEFGAQKFYSISASILLLVVPINLQQINTVHIDLPLAAFFASAGLFAVIYLRTYSLKNLYLSLLSISILVGIKTSGLIYASVILLILLFPTINNFLKELKGFNIKFKKRNFLIFFIVIVPIVFLASFWYVKNFVEIGNPLGNVGVKLFGIPILSGPLDSSKIRGTSLASLFSILSLENWKILLVQTFGRLQLPFIVFIGLHLLLIPYSQRIFSNIHIKKSISLFILLFGSGFLYWNTPYSAADGSPPWDFTAQIFGQGLRYSIPFLAMLCVTSAVILTKIGINKKIVVKVILLCCILGLANTFIYDVIRIQGTFKVNVGGGSVLVDNIIKSFKQNPFSAFLTVSNTMGDSLIEPIVLMLFYCVAILFSKPLILALSKLFQFIYCSYRKIDFRKAALVCIFLVFILSLVTYVLRENRIYSRLNIYGDTFKYVSEHLSPGEKVGYISSNRSYLLYGQNLDKNVIYTGFRSNELNDYINELHNNGIFYLGVGPFIEGNFSSNKESKWIVNSPNLFLSFFDLDPNSYLNLYKVGTGH